MQQLFIVILISFAAGVTMLLGGFLARFLYFNNIALRERFVHGMLAFGAGILMAAVSFVLVPKALSVLPLVWIVFLFVYGTFAFLLFDIIIARLKLSFAQLASMLLDFFPEALVLGASFAIDMSFGALLAIFIALQNFPEGYNTYNELRHQYTKRISLLILFILSLIGVCFAVAGNLFLHDLPHVIAGIMIFASGGIVYLLFEDLAPLSKQDGTWVPALGASLGFLLGIIAEKLLG